MCDQAGGLSERLRIRRLAVGGAGLSGLMEYDRRRIREAAGHTGERVAAGNPLYILRLVLLPSLTQQGREMCWREQALMHTVVPRGEREGHGYSQYDEHNTPTCGGVNIKHVTVNINNKPETSHSPSHHLSNICPFNP